MKLFIKKNKRLKITDRNIKMLKNGILIKIFFFFFYYSMGKGHIQFYSMSRTVKQQQTSEINGNGKIGLFYLHIRVFLRLWWWDNNKMITKVTKKLLPHCRYLWWCIEKSAFVSFTLLRTLCHWIIFYLKFLRIFCVCTRQSEPLQWLALANY